MVIDAVAILTVLRTMDADEVAIRGGSDKTSQTPLRDIMPIDYSFDNLNTGLRETMHCSRPLCTPASIFACRKSPAIENTYCLQHLNNGHCIAGAECRILQPI